MVGGSQQLQVEDALAQLHDEDFRRKDGSRDHVPALEKGARPRSLEFGPDGQPAGLKWRVDSRHGPLGFALPIKAEAVYTVLTQQKIMPTNSQGRKEQANRTAWRIVKEWVAAQMALIETGMVEMEEVFLPYMLTEGRTAYQVLSANKFKALGSGEAPSPR